MQKPENLPLNFNHFTTLPFLWNMIDTSSLFLTEPSNWTDKNDVCSVKRFMELKYPCHAEEKLKHKFFAMCLLGGGETNHHWDIFAQGPSGCCIKFDGEKFWAWYSKLQSNARFGTLAFRKVDYRLHKELTKPNRRKGQKAPTLADLPFIKRNVYSGEKEWRLVWHGRSTDSVRALEFDLTMIKKITLAKSPAVATVQSHLEALINKKLGEKKPPQTGHEIEVVPTGVKDWAKWKNFFQKFTH